MSHIAEGHFRNRDVRGPSPYSVGRIARPSVGQNATRFLIEKRKREEWSRKNMEAQKDRLMQTVKNQFEEITERKCVKRTIENKVDCGMKAASHDLEKRRERLRKLLMEEDLHFKKEACERAVYAENETYAERQRKAENLRMKREQERLRLVEEKRLQQFMNNYEPVRNMIIKRNNEQTYCAQLDQLKEIEERRKSDMEEKAFWDQMDRKAIEKQREKAAADAQEARRKMEEARRALLSQQEYRNISKAEEATIKAMELKELGKIMEQARLEEMEEIQQKRKKREAFKKVLKEQIAEHESAISRQIECDKLLDTQMVKAASEDLVMQREKQNKLMEEAQKEVRFYAEYMEELKLERQKEDKRFEELVETQRKYQEKLRDEEEKLRQKAQDVLRKEVLSQRKLQLEINDKKRAEEKEIQVIEAQLAEKLRLETMRSEREKAKRLSLEKAKYALELKKQMEEMQLKKEREKEESDRLLQKEILVQKNYLSKAKELINSNADKDIHPFRAVLNC
ncbi:hypothetical protein J437_LFUL013540 [Ladona fulva]|uniref:Trichohyalin-plectin-homology domain-containing protein n=1 Tax=Ladona fulva TaxID=123851 RepID=A0A8K0K9V2_LADFU|nr:hypothetical protein J437_LFUL013540 [Ladona fulva]